MLCSLFVLFLFSAAAQECQAVWNSLATTLRCRCLLAMGALVLISVEEGGGLLFYVLKADALGGDTRSLKLG